MRHPATMDIRARQRGAALLILLAILSLGVIFALVAGLNRSAAALAQGRAQKTATALAQAKEALIAYAVTYKDTHDDPVNSKYYVPGYLPCPDLGSSSSEGVAALSCPQFGPSSLVSVIGRLPWKTLGLEALKDGSGECLWYAVSGTYKNSSNVVSGNTTTSNMMNWDTNGQFDVMDADGTTYLAGGSTAVADTRAVAVIFAPDSALSGQNRTPVAGAANCSGNYTPANYLETANSINNSVVSGTASAQSSFIAGTKSDTFNDRLAYITRADIWNAIKKRSDFGNYLRSLTRLAAECTAMYGYQNLHVFPNDLRLPWASKVSLSATSVPTYAVNASYDDLSGVMSGRLAFKVNNARSKTHNNLSSSISDSGTNGAYLFTNSSYCAYTADQKIWYEHWKDQLFYAVANKYNPNANDSPMDACTSSTCLKINGAGSYAAVVIFAGEKLAGQSRNTANDKGAIANYVEAPNSTNILADTGGGNYQAAATTSSFNDIVYAIDTSLAIKCFNGAAMVSVSFPAAAVAPPGDLKLYGACP